MERAAGHLGKPSPFRCALAGEDAKCFFSTPEARRSASKWLDESMTCARPR
jgi:hypothetical protein